VTKQIAVVGGGVVGVCTAYYLAVAGHEVVVIERNPNVAQEGSFGNAGIVAPGHAAPWAAPGLPGRVLRSLFKSESDIAFKPGLDRALWRWLRRWRMECTLERFRLNKLRMQRIARYSCTLLSELREQHQLEYERTQGLLRLFRSAGDIKLAAPELALLAEHGVPHQVLDAEAARTVEPALSLHTPFAGAIHFPQDEAGNCPLFAKRIKQIASTLGVQFHLAARVSAIQPESRGVVLHIDDQRFPADAVVVAAGAESGSLLAPLGIEIPIYPVRGYSATSMIRDYDQAPQAVVVDEAYKVSVTRMGSRIRVAGTAEFGAASETLQRRAVRTLSKVADDWFPQAASHPSATAWSGVYPMLPDGAPLLGATPVPNVYLNVGHGTQGWAMAAGSGKVLADILSGNVPEIDMDGLTLARYG
jgi:D-amino-acid dehydrogenase